MTGHSKSLWKTRRGRWITALVALWLVYTIGGFLIAPIIIKWQIGKQVPPLLHREVSVEKVRVNPYALSLGIYGLKLTETNGAEFAGLGEFYGNLQISSLFKSVWVLDEVRIGSPSASIVRFGKFTFNFSDLLTNAAATPKSAMPFQIPRVEIGRISITNGLVALADLSETNEFRSTIAPIELLLTNFTTVPDRTSPHRFEATVGSGETISWQGRISVQPPGASGRLEVKNFTLPGHRRYLDELMLARVAEGTVDVAFEYFATLTAQQTNVVVTNLAVNVHKLRIVTATSGEEIGSLDKALVEGGYASLAEKRISVARIFASDGRGLGRRYPSTSTESTRLFNAETIREFEKLFHELNDEWGWILSAPDIVLTNLAPHFEDVTMNPPARLAATNLSVAVQGLSNAKNAPVRFQVGVELPPGGSASVSGEATLVPIFAKAAIKSQGVDVRPMAPYVRAFVPVNLLSGRAGADLEVVFAPGAASNGLVQVTGGLSMEDFNTSQAPANTDLLRWKEFHLDGLKLTIEPLSFHAQEIGFEGVVTDVIVDADRQLNFLKLAGISTPSLGEAAPAKTLPVPATKPSPSELPPISVGTFRIKGAALRFKDESINPHAFGGVQELSGTVQGLTTSPSLRAVVDLKGRVDEQGPFSIAGEIQPFAVPLFIDLAVGSRGVSLSPTSPYFGEFAGYPVQKGKVSSDLKWRVENRAIKAENVITVDQLTLGKRTGSTNATKLPVKLGIALLTDTDGRIELKVPVAGSLDDPKFKLNQVIWRVVENILIKAATAPFALLGSMFGGGGEELGQVDFGAGSAHLDPTATERLEMLSTALAKRPLLTLEISGGIEPRSDREALQAARFLDSIKARKVDEMIAAGQAAVPLAEVKLEPTDYDRLLLVAFTNAFGPLPLTTNLPLPANPTTAVASNVVPTNDVTDAKSAAPTGRKFSGSTSTKGAGLISLSRMAPNKASPPTASPRTATPTDESQPAPTRMPTSLSTGDGIARSEAPSREEMERRLRARIQISDNDLNQLRDERANTVQRYLLAKPGLSAERVYLRDRQQPADTETEARRVIMSLN